MNMHATLRQSLRSMSPCLGFLILSLALAGCTAKAPPLSPKAAAFKKDVGAILARLAPALAGATSREDYVRVRRRREAATRWADPVPAPPGFYFIYLDIGQFTCIIKNV
jgi:hypothetical protein